MNEQPGMRKTLSVIGHVSIIFGVTLIAIGVPIALLFVSNDPIVQANAKEAINFHINLIIWWFVIFLLCFVLVGFPLIIVFILVSFIMPIVAVVNVSQKPDEAYRYPFIWHPL